MNELEEILHHIDNGDNFLLSGGAGSGKTYSLVQVIKEVIKRNPAEKVFCITYTNTAVREIEERVNHKNLKISTIHAFLWEIINQFQTEIKQSLITLANDFDCKLYIDNDGHTVPDNYFDEVSTIQYKEYLKIEKGIISHDEVIWLSEYMFKTYVKLCDILKDKYKFIFVDEYQDTHREVVDILLIHLQQSSRKNIIGFFGDAMQSIYENGVDDINVYVNDGLLKEVLKKQNRRSPKQVIELANRLRTDSVIQQASDDGDAPNMHNGTLKNGSIKFIYSDNADIENIKNYLAQNDGWDFSDNKNVKELNLTHNLIAGKAKFRNLMDIYNSDQVLKFRDRIKKYIKENDIQDDFSSMTFEEVIEALRTHCSTTKELKKLTPTKGMQSFIDEHQELYKYALQYDYNKLSKLYVDKEQFLDDKKQTEDEEAKKGSKRDNLIKHLFKIQQAISLYQNQQYNEFLRVTDYKINSIQDKRDLKANIESLIDVGNKSIEEIIDEADSYGICRKDDKLDRFMNEKEYLYNRVKKVKFSEFQNLFEYLEGRTPFTTQHKTKGDEFDNVLVILDNGKWYDYNFEYLFLNDGRETVLERTKKLFYVCCTRTKENLVIFYYQPSSTVIEKAKEWFGEDNIIKI